MLTARLFAFTSEGMALRRSIADDSDMKLSMLRFTVAVIILGVSTILAAASWQAIQTQRERRQFTAPGKLIPVGGRRVHLYCMGSAAPTILISAGTGVLSLQWSRIQRDLAKDARVCNWDRSGFGWSEMVSDPHTAAQAADELWGALQAAGETGRFVLVGESYGGYVSRLFQARHPSCVAVIVLVESAHERQWDEIPQAKALLTGAVGRLKATVWLSRVGFLLWTSRDDGGDLPSDVRPALIALQSRTETVQAVLAEVNGVFESANQVGNTPPLGSLPLIVVSAGRSFQRFLPNGDPEQLRQMNEKCMQLQDDLCHLSSNCVHLVRPDATHGIA
jgi:pimeloyl-ACP methyl ester carboxylesterase